MPDEMRGPGLEDLGGSWVQSNTLRPDCKQWAADSIATRIPPALVYYLGCWVFRWLGGWAVGLLCGSVFGWLDG